MLKIKIICKLTAIKKTVYTYIINLSIGAHAYRLQKTTLATWLCNHR